MQTLSGQLEPYEPAELVVDMPHLGIVRAELRKLGISYEQKDESEPLRLVLLALTKLDKEIRRLRADTELVKAAMFVRLVSGRGGTSVEDLDLVMFAIRKSFADRYEGWTPTLGKNRLMAGVEGSPHIGGGAAAAGGGEPHIGGGGAGDPQPLTDDKRLAALRDEFPVHRDAEPAARPVRVGVLDTAIVARPELKKSLADRGDVIADLKFPVPSLMGHATFVAGLIVKRAPQVELDVRAVLSDANATARVWDVAKRMAEFANPDPKFRVDVLNMSFVCATADGQQPLVLTRAVELLRPNVVLVAAAGNHGNVEPRTRRVSEEQRLTSRTAMWPAASDEVIAIGATDEYGDSAPFSPAVPWIDLTAPGVDVESTYFDGEVKLFHETPDAAPERFNGFAVWSGTSFAAATVTGEIARRTAAGVSANDAVKELCNPSDGDIRPFRCH
jgi:subtilisin family serine protease